jgi:hypothetical protein
MRENRTSGSEGGEGCLPDPYRAWGHPQGPHLRCLICTA